jgi:outer membrane protein assembly factor BamA
VWAEDLHERGIYPRLSSFAPGTGIAPGIDYWRPSLGGTRIGFLGSAQRSLRGDTLFQVRFGRFPRPVSVLKPSTGYPSLEGLAPFPGPHSGESPTFLYVEATGRELVGGRLYRADGQLESYRSNDSSLDLVGGYVLAPGLAFSARLGTYETRVGGLNGDVSAVAPQFGTALTAIGYEVEYTRFNLELALDTRDSAGDPRSGAFLSAAWWGYEDRGAGVQGDHSFHRFELDGRYFQPLGSERHVLALRGWASLADAAGGGIPFNLQQSLGGSRMLRGYPGFRFPGHDVIAASAEYRFHLRPRVELAAFYDIGQVRGGLADREPTDLLSSWGGGIRLKGRSGVLLRLDVAKAREGAQAHLKFGYSF